MLDKAFENGYFHNRNIRQSQIIRAKPVKASRNGCFHKKNIDKISDKAKLS